MIAFSRGKNLRKPQTSDYFAFLVGIGHGGVVSPSKENPSKSFALGVLSSERDFLNFPKAVEAIGGKASDIKGENPFPTRLEGQSSEFVINKLTWVLVHVLLLPYVTSRVNSNWNDIRNSVRAY